MALLGPVFLRQLSKQLLQRNVPPSAVAVCMAAAGLQVDSEYPLPHALHGPVLHGHTVSQQRYLHRSLAARSSLAAELDTPHQVHFTDTGGFMARMSSVTEGPAVVYREGRKSGFYRGDRQQEDTIAVLQHLYDELRRVHPPRRRPSGLTMVDNVEANSKQGWWQGISNMLHHSEASQSSIKGVYLYGGVGTGKTMLMDLLVHAAPPDFMLKRQHFHDFMLDVHSRLQALKNKEDPLAQVAAAIASEVRVLALDEFFVTDVADAAILSRLFGRLWELGMVLVTTSNRAPDALYEGGLQRNLFLPFIEKLKEACLVHDISSPTDYRRLAQHRRGLYFTGPRGGEELEQRFRELTNNNPVQRGQVQVMMGRQLHVEKAGGCICMFSFGELCGKPLAAADYIALTGRYHTLALAGVPVFTAANRSAAYRFVTLIDVLYEHRIRLFCSAEAQPVDLFQYICSLPESKEKAESLDKAAQDLLVVDDNLSFAKDRTISRLTEMQSSEFLLAHAEQHAPELILALKEAQSSGNTGAG